MPFPEKPLIAVIEDEVILRDLMTQELEKKGYRVVTAGDGLTGWNLILKHRPDLILLDLLMPVMSGYDVLAKLREEKEYKDIPCIVISNSGQSDDLNRAYSYGANDVLIKADFNPDQLVMKVGHLLKKEESA